MFVQLFLHDFDLHQKHPSYQWDKNKGYPTKSHRNAIREIGASPYHRKSFNLLNPQLEIDL